jgi:apolipoprotein N-acyltransferase
LPLVRAANNGISAVVDAYGRTTAVLALGETGIVDADLPAAISATPYARWGDGGLIGLALVLLGLAAVCRRWG